MVKIKEVEMPEKWERCRNLENYTDTLLRVVTEKEKQEKDWENIVSECCGAPVLSYTFCKSCGGKICGIRK